MKKKTSTDIAPTKTWYDLPVPDVISTLESGEKGLSSDEARARLARYGFNELRFKHRGWLARFAAQFRNTLIYVLMAAGLATALLGMWVDALVIFVVVIANAIIGFIQEGKAEASMKALTQMMVRECTVLRNGEHEQIPARELVSGDLVVLGEGDQIPADLRLAYARNLSIDEAALTGESVPVDKSTGPIPKEGLTPADQKCMAFGGTFVSRGSGRGFVVATGTRTEIGKIAELMKETAQPQAAPLIRKMARFTRLLIVVVLVLAAINVILGATLGDYDLVYAFLASVSLAVAAIPEGLPAILTIALAFSARTMSKRNVVVRKLPAVETLGSATVICSDKTGTLTRGEMTVVRIFAGGRDYGVTGTGYVPTGDFLRDAESVDPRTETDLLQVLTAGVRCSSAHLNEVDGGYEIIGDPTEGAIVVSARKAGIADDGARLDEWPFNSDTRYMVTLYTMGDHNVVYVKGSPEKIVTICRDQMVDGHAAAFDGQSVLDNLDEMALGALRILGFACKIIPAERTALDLSDLEGMTFLGLQGMIDPPREEAIDAIAHCKRAGIRVVMITGDHAATARAVARKLGIGSDGDEVITGEQLATMDDEALFELVDRVSIYARVAPVHKYRIAIQLKRRGHIVAMTGDGVNDAPALKAADLGIAMGKKGTDVTKEAADIILVDDNFASIVAAVEEGRHVFENIRKVILYTLPTNGGQALLVIGAIALIPFSALFGERLPLEPIHILWINLYDSIALALPLLWEPREKGLLDRPPRDPKEPIANRLFFRKVGLVSVMMAGAAFFVFNYYGSPAIENGIVDEERLGQAQTAAFMTVMMMHIFYLLSARSLTKSAFTMNPFSNKWVIVGIASTLAIQLLIVYGLPSTGFNPLRTEPFPAEWWIVIVLLGLPGLLVTELEEYLVEFWGKRIRGGRPVLKPRTVTAGKR